jgi:hypothetical protein
VYVRAAVIPKPPKTSEFVERPTRWRINWLKSTFHSQKNVSPRKMNQPPLGPSHLRGGFGFTITVGALTYGGGAG